MRLIAGDDGAYARPLRCVGCRLRWKLLLPRNRHGLSAQQSQSAVCRYACCAGPVRRASRAAVLPDYARYGGARSGPASCGRRRALTERGATQSSATPSTGRYCARPWCCSRTCLSRSRASFCSTACWCCSSRVPSTGAPAVRAATSSPSATHGRPDAAVLKLGQVLQSACSRLFPSLVALAIPDGLLAGHGCKRESGSYARARGPVRRSLRAPRATAASVASGSAYS